MVGLGATSAPAADAKGVGPQPSGLGLGSKAALAQKTCTPNGNTSFVYVGDGPNCVNPWAAGKDNGGATAPGVTATEVKVVFYVPNEQMRAAASPAALPKNQGTKVPATPQQVVTDWDKVFQYAIEHSGTWQTWGRKPVFDFVAATGTDETTQRADALAVIAKKPFIVFDAVNRATGAPVFASTIAASKIIVVSASTDAENGAKQSPYRWAEGQDPAAAIYVTASFVGQVLSGKKARWAGDSAMTSKTRSFGVVSPAAGFDIAAFDQQLKKNRGSAPASEVHYDGLQPTKNDEVAPVLVTKLKAAGVTSVVLFTSPAMTESLMAAATTQEFRPEWIITGYLFHDWDFWSRERDQDQMAHAFGLGVLPPRDRGRGFVHRLLPVVLGRQSGQLRRERPGRF